jgi:hypothetical protein
VKVLKDKQEEVTLWPMILEKAYAKMFGSFKNIVGGLVHVALADLTNGIPEMFALDDKEVKEW